MAIRDGFLRTELSLGIFLPKVSIVEIIQLKKIEFTNVIKLIPG